MSDALSTPVAAAGQEGVWETGVYCWRCLANGKVYVGSAGVSLNGRRDDHLKRLRGRYHYNKHLQRAWDKHGEVAFQWEVLERCPSEQCVPREQFWMDRLKATKKRFGYNMTPTAGSQLGFKHSEETKRQNGERKRGTKQSEEAKKKVSESSKAYWADSEHRAMRVARMTESARRPELRERRGSTFRGKKLTPEHRAKLSAAAKGRVISPEQRAKISATLKAKDRSNWDHMRGRAVSESTKAKMSQSLKGKVPHNKGKGMPKEQRARLVGRKHSAETRAKMSASKKALWAAKKGRVVDEDYPLFAGIEELAAERVVGEAAAAPALQEGQLVLDVETRTDEKPQILAGSPGDE